MELIPIIGGMALAYATIPTEKCSRAIGKLIKESAEARWDLLTVAFIKDSSLPIRLMEMARLKTWMETFSKWNKELKMVPEMLGALLMEGYKIDAASHLLMEISL
jgi:hypothetical protein